jgi:hypothetical protein
VTYAGERGCSEAFAEGFVCDALTEEGEFIEVQTGSFAPLKKKAALLSRKGPLRIVHPIIVEKQIALYDAAGNLCHRRRSPRRGTPWDLFKALVYAPLLPLTRNVTIELVLVDVEEKRVQDGKGSWRRGFVSIADRSLLAQRESIILRGPRDYTRFIPFEKNETFTVKALAQKAGVRAALASKCLYVLTKLGAAERVGKGGAGGRAFLYRKT